MKDRTLKLLSPLLYWSGGFSRAWRAEAGASGPTGVVVTYHRVRAKGEAGRADWLEAERGIDARTLRAHMAFMLRHFTPAPLAEILAGPGDGHRMRFAVTFDDGYEDNLTVAAPLLKSMGIPATAFVVSEYVGTDRRFWWESLAEMVRTTPRTSLSAGEASPDLAALEGALPLETQAQKEEAHRTLVRALNRIEAGRVWGVLDRLGEALGVAARREGRDYRLMDWAQLEAIQAQGFEIGGHTASHANLGAGEPGAIAGEVEGCVTALARRLGRPVRTFAYPYGGPDNRSEAAAKAIERQGCVAAVTTDVGLVRRGTSPWLWPRIDLNKTWGFACAYNVERARRAR